MKKLIKFNFRGLSFAIMKSTLIDFQSLDTKVSQENGFCISRYRYKRKKNVCIDCVCVVYSTLNIIISIKQNKLIPSQSQTNKIKFPIT